MRYPLFPTHFTIRDHLAVAVTVGVLGIAFVSFVVGHWYQRIQLRAHHLAQGIAATSNLGQRSVLAILYQSPDNAAEVVGLAMSTPDVAAVEIRTAQGTKVLFKSADDHAAQPPKDELPPSFAATDATPSLAYQTDRTNVFVAPVFSTRAISPYLEGTETPELLGYVRLTQTTTSLNALTKSLLMASLTTLIIFSVPLVVLIRILTTRLMRPLAHLATAMGNAERGEVAAPAPEVGPMDIRGMALAFNHMMKALLEREHQLQSLVERNRALVRHTNNAREDQSRLIAQDLHDTLGGHLSMLKLGLAALLEEPTLAPKVATELRDLQSTCADALGLAKNLTAALRPATLDTLGFNRTVIAHITEWSRKTHITIDHAFVTDCAVTPNTAIVLYRVVQEGLSNIARHASAMHVTITTRIDGASYILLLSDDGIGFAGVQRGFGLMGIEERVCSLGGTFEIATDGPTMGTTLIIHIPIEGPD